MINLQEQNFIIYSTANNDINIQILIDKDKETIWLSQKKIAELFGVDKASISRHIANILSEKELGEATVAKIATVQTEGSRQVKREIEHYNLDMVIAVGYRVNSFKATQFRIWATKTLREFIIKGFVLDDERLKQGNNIFNKDFLNELIERIREIRASERIFYEKIKEAFKLSIDYAPNSDEAKRFFASVQNRLEYAVTSKTAAEIVWARADSTKPNMGLTNWSGSGRGLEPIKKDVSIAKNYLSKDELSELNRLTTMLLDYVETQVKRGNVFTMSDWHSKTDGFLEFNGYDVLSDNGSRSSRQAKEKAELEYQKFKAIKNNQDFKKIK